MLEHRDIKGTVEFDQETKMFFGKLIGVNGLVMYEAENAQEFEKNFISAVDEYIQMCEENGMPIKRDFKGVFNVRTSPENHERLFTISEGRGLKLNAIINEALDYYLTSTEKISSFDLLTEDKNICGYIPVAKDKYVWQAGKRNILWGNPNFEHKVFYVNHHLEEVSKELNKIVEKSMKDSFNQSLESAKKNKKH